MAAGLGLAVLAGRAGPAQAPALYDGLCIGAAYHYLAPPPNQPHTPPSAAHKTDPVDVSAGSVSTDESPPQAQVLFSGGTFRTPPGAATIDLSLTPVPPPAAAPPNGHIDGNVYRLAVTAGGAAAPPRPDHPVTVVLRSPEVTTNESLDLYANGQWKVLPTSAISCAFQWTANTSQLGDLALVNPAGAPAVGTKAPAQPAAGGPLRLLLATAGGLLVLAAALVGLVRLARRRGASRS